MNEKSDEQKLQPVDYESAIHSQTACNLSGLIYSFANVIKRICTEARIKNHGTDWKNNHSICRLYAEQIYHLTNSKDYNEAFTECELKSKYTGAWMRQTPTPLRLQ